MVQSGVESLVLSIVPGDIGKVTTRLEKAAIRGGVCRWENPVYETIKLFQEPKTGKFSERVYYFVVSTVRSLKFSVSGSLLCVSDCDLVSV